MDFDDRLKSAISRGQSKGKQASDLKKAATLSQEELKGRHAQLRLQLSEHIEKGIKKLADHFPGFRYETIYGEKGWGGACWRDDVGPGANRKRANFYSRFEMTIRPHSEFNVVDLAAKGTVRNKETLRRNHFQEIEKVDPDQFLEMIDHWIVEFAEQYAAS